MERLDWDDARIFLALVREGTLTGAAQRLKTGIATVSRRVARLEAALGVPLFLRHQTGHRLSDQGKALLPRVEAVELAVLAMGQDAAQQTEIRGHVRLVCFESLVAPVLVPALAPLLAANSGLDLEVLFTTTTVNRHRRDADLAVRLVRSERGHLRLGQLAAIGFGLYGPPDGTVPARHVFWPERDSLSVVLSWVRTFGAAAAPRLAVNTLPGQVAAVLSGAGVSVLPHFLAREAGLRLLTDRLTYGARMERPVLLVGHADLATSRRVVAVAEAVADGIGARRRDLAEP